MRWILHVTAWACVLATLPLAAAPANEVRARAGDELARLEDEYTAAREQWKADWAAARKAGVSIRERPEDPVGSFWPRFEALFEAGEGRAAFWLIENARNADLDRKERKARQTAIAAQAFEEHANEAWLEKFCFLLSRRKRDFDAEAMEGWIAAWREGELPPELLAASLWLEAEVLAWNRKAREANGRRIEKALRAALAAAPESESGKKAGGDLFRRIEQELGDECTPWLERELGEKLARPDLAPYRERMRALGAAGVESAQVWLLGSTWLDEPDADYDRLIALADEAGIQWGALAAEMEEEYDAEAGLNERMMMLFTHSPEALFWYAFDELADRDPRAVAWLIENSEQVSMVGPAMRTRQFQRLERIVQQQPDASWAVDVADVLVRGARNPQGTEELTALCSQWADATTDEEVEIRLRFVLAMARLAKDQDQGVALLRELIERWPEHEYASNARGRIASLTQLAIGMAAPEITAADLDGVEFKLSDYRGKVVVLDFWGDW